MNIDSDVSALPTRPGFSTLFACITEEYVQFEFGGQKIHLAVVSENVQLNVILLSRSAYRRCVIYAILASAPLSA